MEYDGVQANPVQETQTGSELVQLIEYRSSNFDDSEFSGVGRMVARAKNPQVSFDFTFGTE